MKRIVICCDGTWNWPDKTEDGQPCATNVVKMANAICRSDDSRNTDSHGNGKSIVQEVYYDAGVGSSGNSLKRLFDGATGTGMSKNIQQAYRYLVRVYEPGDELYFFGFSRGAYTVRSLAGLIRNAGILRREFADKVEDAYALYRSGDPDTHPNGVAAQLFRRTHALADMTPIHCIGVWDTVGSLGNPLLFNKAMSAFSWFNRRNNFHDTQLSCSVKNAFHALAIEEKRAHFAAALWQQLPQNRACQRLEQVWFPGVHANVGGGYPCTGLSDIALEWMAEKAAACGLALKLPDTVYPDPAESSQESRAGAYRLIPVHWRPVDHPENRLLQLQGEMAQANTCEHLHDAVLEKYLSEASWRPENLEDYFRRRPDKRPLSPSLPAGVGLTTEAAD